MGDVKGVWAWKFDLCHGIAGLYVVVFRERDMRMDREVFLNKYVILRPGFGCWE